jgi:predicted RNase H-like HicB family nuclease
MRVRAKFVQDGNWWVGWTQDVPGVIIDGPTLADARARLIAEIRRMREPVDPEPIAEPRVVVEELEV